jgi:hypothetical protein
MNCYLSIVKIKRRPRNGPKAPQIPILGDKTMTTQDKARNLVIRIVERMFDRAGVLMLLALGLATAGATAGL